MSKDKIRFGGRMRRRTFVGTAAAAAVLAGLPSSAFADDKSGSNLRALAETVIPDIQSGAWSNGPCRLELEKRWRGLDSKDAGEWLAALGSLDGASWTKFRNEFSILSLEQRTEVVAGLLGNDKKFKDIFWRRIRPFFIYIYFESDTGMKRTGYRDTTQFEGYPDIAAYPAGREGN